MHALNSLRDPEHKYEKGLSDVDVLLGATLEIEHRLHGPQRAFQLWKPELWHGAYLLRRYRVSILLKTLGSISLSSGFCEYSLGRIVAKRLGLWLSGEEVI